MSKKNKKKRQREARPKGRIRTDLVLAIVATDSTFELHNDVWIGKCLHCNCKIAVTQQGTTGATVEHIVPLTAGGSAVDLTNTALACKVCNNRKGIDHDLYVGRGGRADEVIAMLREKRLQRWRDSTMKPEQPQ